MVGGVSLLGYVTRLEHTHDFRLVFCFSCGRHCTALASEYKLRFIFISVGCLRFTKLGWVGKHTTNTMKPTNSPTQGQPNPRKNKLGHIFPQRVIFRGLGLILRRKQTTITPTQPDCLPTPEHQRPSPHQHHLNINTEPTPSAPTTLALDHQDQHQHSTIHHRHYLYAVWL